MGGEGQEQKGWEQLGVYWYSAKDVGSLDKKQKVDILEAASTGQDIFFSVGRPRWNAK